MLPVRWNVATILNEADPLEMLWRGGVPVMHAGYDKQCRPIVLERAGGVRVGPLMEVLSRDDFYYRTSGPLARYCSSRSS